MNEGPVWDARAQRLYWVDIVGRELNVQPVLRPARPLRPVGNDRAPHRAAGLARHQRHVRRRGPVYALHHDHARDARRGPLAEEPLAGSVLAIVPGVKGIAEVPSPAR